MIYDWAYRLLEEGGSYQAILLTEQRTSENFVSETGERELVPKLIFFPIYNGHGELMLGKLKEKGD